MNKFFKSIILSVALASASYTPQKALVISHKTASNISFGAAVVGGVIPWLLIDRSFTPVPGASPCINALLADLHVRRVVETMLTFTVASGISLGALVSRLLMSYTPAGILEWAEKEIEKIKSSDLTHAEKQEQFAAVDQCLLQVQVFLDRQWEFVGEHIWELPKHLSYDGKLPVEENFDDLRFTCHRLHKEISFLRLVK
jgi:hypothetical protein